MLKKFRSYDMNQPFLLPPDMKDWLSENHLSYFISELVDHMDLTEIYGDYMNTRGKPAFDPRLLLKLLIYGYCVNVRSSRKIEKKTFEDIPFRVLAADQHPDHDTISEFRRRHLSSFSVLFLQVLEVAKKAGLVKAGHISLDGTKVKANAKKSKSRKYSEMLKTTEDLETEIAQILAEAEETDRREDKLYGKGKTGEELPKKLLDKKKRKALIEKLIRETEAEAEDRGRELREEKKRKAQQDSRWEEETGQKIERRPPTAPPEGEPAPITEARRNPTDFESRIMKDSQTGGYIQGYNCQAAVDADSQVIVAADVVNNTNDKQLLVPMMDQVKSNIGLDPQTATADNGYYSERDIVSLMERGIDPYVPPTKNTKGKRRIPVGRNGKKRTVTEHMRDKLETKTGHEIYKTRKSITEPVFGQIKEQMGFRSFLLRGLEKAKAEWQLIAMGHNIRKIYRALG